jgi:acetyl esterase/lipase
MHQCDKNDDGDEEFTGSPSPQSQRVVAGLRLVRSIAAFFRLDFGTLLVHLTASTSPPRRLVRSLNVDRSEFDGMPVWTMRSAIAARSTNSHVLCLHGGAYVHQATATHWRDYAKLARDTGAAVVVPIYPLAPKGTAATVVPRIADLISQFVSEHGADAVSVYGDSAGGGLALAATQELVRRSAPTPARMVLISPWLDVTLSDPGIADIDDPALSPTTLRDAGRKWADGLDLRNPLVSPLFGPLAGLPSTTVYSGSLDVLCVDAIRLRAKAIDEGADDVTFVLRKGLIHDWAISPLPEAVAVRPDIYRQLLHAP